MRRRAVLPALLLVVLLTTAGCWSRVEVNDLAIISLVALDRTPEGELQVLVHVVVPSGAGAAAAASGSQGGGGGGRPGGAPFITVTGRGRTVMEAARKMQLQLPRRLFWAHVRVILLGENLARQGVRPVLDFLTRHRELRLTNYLLVARGDLSTLSATPMNLERLPGESLRETLRSFTGVVVNVGDFARLLAAKGADPALGVVDVVPPPAGAAPGQTATLKVAGTALFQHDKLVGFLDDRDTRGMLWLQNKARHGVLSLVLPGTPGYVSMEMIKATVRRSAILVGNQPAIQIDARAEGDIGEESAPLDLSDPTLVNQLEDQLTGEVKKYMLRALDQQRKLNVDAAGFGEVVHQDLPAVWKRLEKNWLRQGARNVKVSINVRVRIRRTGLSNKPRGINEDELIEKGR